MNSTLTRSVQIKALSNGSGWIAAEICVNGFSTVITKYIQVIGSSKSGGNDLSDGFILSYPNPVSTILNIEIDPSSASGRQQTSYDIRLYDGQGNMLHQAAASGSPVAFNVANLQDGIYYLHVYDQVGGKPFVRQIVVQH